MGRVTIRAASSSNIGSTKEQKEALGCSQSASTRGSGSRKQVEALATSVEAGDSSAVMTIVGLQLRRRRRRL